MPPPARRQALAALCLAALALAARGEPAKVDWRRRVVRCTGTGAPDARAARGNVAVARIAAEKAARRDALRNCLEAVKGVAARSGETAAAADRASASSVGEAVQRLRLVGAPRYFSDGGVSIDVEVPLDGKLTLPSGPDGAVAEGREGEGR